MALFISGPSGVVRRMVEGGFLPVFERLALRLIVSYTDLADLRPKVLDTQVGRRLLNPVVGGILCRASPGAVRALGECAAESFFYSVHTMGGVRGELLPWVACRAIFWLVPVGAYHPDMRPCILLGRCSAGRRSERRLA